MKKFCSIFFMVFFLSLGGIAQTLPFRNYSIEKGLSEAVVNGLMQDHEGYIWIATSYGLNRFDGIQFQNFYEENGLSNNKVYALLEDSSHTIWVGTASGVNIIKGDSIKTMPELNPIKPTTVVDIFQDRNKQFWFATAAQGVWHLDQGNDLTQYSSVNGLADDKVQAIAEDDNGTLWFGTGGGLSQLKDGNFRTFTVSDGLADNKIRDLKLGQDGKTLWIATLEGLSRYKDGKFTNFTTKDGLVSNHIQSLSLDGKGGIWLGTEEGASHFSKGSFTNFSTKQGLINNKIYATLFSREHNVWFGTYGNGVSLFLGEQFKNYTIEQGLPNNVITSIREDENGTHWITTFGGGLTKYNDHTFTTYNEDSGLINNNAYVSYVNRKNHLFVGTQWGLSIYDGVHFKNYNEYDLPYHQIRAITGSSERPGEYWLGTYGKGLLRYRDGSFTSFSEGNGIANNTILAVKEGPDNGIWVASYGGVSRFRNGSFTNYSVKQGLPNNGVLDILVTKDNQIWVSTFGGIARYDKQHDSFTAITAKDGLPDEVCYFIIQDDAGLFWIGTNKGVIRFDYAAYQQRDKKKNSGGIFKLITQQQGLVTNEMNAGAGFKDREGRLWFGSVDGLTVYNPRLANNNHAAPKIHIESVQLSGETVRAGSHLQVKSNNRNITFHYVGISFTAPDQVVYAYRLKGSGEDWQQTSQRSVRYSSLFPGDYTFEVKARNSDGLMSAKTATLSFSVMAPFWLQWWFFAIIFVAVAGIIFFVYNFYRVRKMVDMERMRVRIASDLHDDVGSSLTEIALQSDFLQTTDASTELKESLQTIGAQSRRIVSSLDDIVWSIDARNDTLGDLTDRMQDYLNNILSDRKVRYNFGKLDMDKKLTATIRENLYLIFKEAVNNIAKHSNATEVEISLKTDGKSFTLTINDNGTNVSGRRKTGHGLRNMKMRGKRIDAMVTLNNKNGFTVSVSGKYQA